MTQLIDHLITAALWAGLAYLAMGFVADAIQRSSKASQPICRTESGSLNNSLTCDLKRNALFLYQKLAYKIQLLLIAAIRSQKTFRILSIHYYFMMYIHYYFHFEYSLLV